MKVNEKNFIKRLKKKDEKALEYIIDKYGWLIKKIINKYLFNLESYKEDCLNEIFLSIWNNIDSYNSEKSSFENWICVIAKYKSIDYLRMYLEKSQTEDIDNMKISETPKELEMEIKENFEELIAPLNEKDKAIFRKIFYDDISYEETAEDMELSKDAIYKRVSRGKKKIKEYVENGGYDNE